MPASSLPGSARTTRNRKLECECGYVVRASRTMIRRGLPTCCCGGRLVPAALEDALLAHECGHLTDTELEAHPEHWHYMRELQSVAHGQAGPGRRRMDGGRGLQQPEAIAFQRVAKARTATAYAARLAALEPHRYGGAPSTDPIPF